MVTVTGLGSLKGDWIISRRWGWGLSAIRHEGQPEGNECGTGCPWNAWTTPLVYTLTYKDSSTSQAQKNLSQPSFMLDTKETWDFPHAKWVLDCSSPSWHMHLAWPAGGNSSLPGTNWAKNSLLGCREVMLVPFLLSQGRMSQNKAQKDFVKTGWGFNTWRFLNTEHLPSYTS